MKARQARPLPEGAIPALVTPMQRDGSIDLGAFRDLLDRQVSSGSSGVVVAGSTGEGAALTPHERIRLIAAAVDRIGSQTPVIAGCSATAASATARQVIEAQDAGADAVLVPSPAYSRPTQEGLYVHFCSIAEAATLPLILYDVPARTGVDIKTETVLRLARTSSVVGLKDATGDIGRAIQVLRQMPDGFTLYSGDDRTAAALMLLGARGVISVAANVAPKALHGLCRAALTGDVSETRRISRVLSPLIEALGVESNPIPVKHALARQTGGGYLRPPLTPLAAHLGPVVDAALADLERDLESSAA